MFSFLNLISFEHNFGQKNNLNFLLIKNLNYFFVQNYVQKKLNLKKKTLQILVKSTLKYRIREDEVFLRNSSELLNKTLFNKKLFIK